MFKLWHGDCLELMKDIPDGSVDAVIADIPYGTTACKWDSVIPLDAMWQELKRIIKPSGAIVLFGSEPFASTLRVSNLEGYAHDWVWTKRFAANFVQAKRQPLKDHESVIVFSKSGRQPSYYPQMTKRDKPIKIGRNKNTSGAVPLVASRSHDNKVYSEKYPTTTALHYSARSERGLHPTQKPVALLEYLIKTYTNQDETVLDFTMGSGSTGVACAKTNRNFIGIELDRDYYDIAVERINKAKEAANGDISQE